MYYSCSCSKHFGQSSHLHILVSYFLWVLVIFVHTHCWLLPYSDQHFACYKSFFLVHLLSLVSNFKSVSIHNLCFSNELSCDFETMIWNILRQNYFKVPLKCYAYFNVIDRLFQYCFIFSRDLEERRMRIAQIYAGVLLYFLLYATAFDLSYHTS